MQNEIDRLKQKRADILRAYSRHEITAAEAIKRKDELDRLILKAQSVERRK